MSADLLWPNAQSPEDITAIEEIPLDRRGLPACTYDVVLRAARLWPDRIAITVLPDGTDYARSARRTFGEVAADVTRAAKALRHLGLDRRKAALLISPNCDELISATLAAEAAGIAVPINGSLSGEHIAELARLSGARILITAAPELDPAGVQRAAALAEAGLIDSVVLLRPTLAEGPPPPPPDLPGVIVVYLSALLAEYDAQPLDDDHAESADLAALFHTGGTTGKPKGIVHTTGGYLVQAAVTHHDTFDLHPESDVFWCTADVGWVTGHSYVAYAPLVNGATQVIYEGTPDSPHQGRWWEIVQKYGVSILYTAPTAIRTFMKWGRHIPDEYDLSSLRVLGSVGEAINPEAWRWYHEVIGAGRCPIVDTWWQTETGAHMLTPLPGVTTLKPGSAQRPVPGVVLEVVDELGEPMTDTSAGFLVVREPWPSMLRGIWGDRERFKETYWSRFPGMYFAGDGARYDEDGDIWLLGRVDDVMNVSGHRLSTTEIESSLVAHPSVAESAVVGAKDETTGEAVVAFVLLTEVAAAAGARVPSVIVQALASFGPTVK